MIRSPIRSILLLANLAAAFFMLDGTVFGQLSKIENRFPEKVPLKIELKNYGSPEWIEDLEISVTNTGDKPIYYLYFFLTLDKASAGMELGIPFIYGKNKKLIGTSGRAEPNDVPILPGASHIFKVRQDIVDGWPATKADRKIREPLDAHLSFIFLNFGDGTGIEKESRSDKKP